MQILVRINIILAALLFAISCTTNQELFVSYSDPNIYTHFIPYKGTPGHPNITEQQEMANNLIQFIDQNINCVGGKFPSNL